MNRDCDIGSVTTGNFRFVSSMFAHPWASFETIRKESEEIVAEHSKELDDFLKEFALKEVS